MQMTGSRNLAKVEFHCHTIFSKDSLVTPEELIAVCRARGIDRVVVTDHNTIAGAVAAKEIDPELVIVGEEIMTKEGELLAAFVREEIPKGLPAEEVIAWLREQEAFISVSHPFDVTRSGHWELADLERIAPLVDAVEVFNARCLMRSFNHRAAEFSKKHSLLSTVGSDAHTSPEYGRATMLLPEFHDTISLMKSLAVASSDTHYSGLGVRFGSRYAVLHKQLSS
jgi:predicted metal-dependent phosphoesterase TrpH